MLSYSLALLCFWTSASSQTVTVPSGSITLSKPDVDADVRDLRYDDLARDLTQIPPGLDHDLFAGVLADRTSRFDESIRLLTPLSVTTDLPPSRMALVLGSLADDNVKLFHYAAASTLYDRLFSSYADQLPPTLLKDDQDDNDTLKLLLTAPPQTIDIDGPVDLPTHSDPLGSFAAGLTVHGITVPWILDTGANFSVVSETFAHQLGLTFSTGVAHTMGATGAENSLHTAIIDTLPLGRATLHNVVVLILPDANLTIQSGKKKSYTIPAILGYPVFQALGIIRFTRDHHFLAGPALQTTGTSSPVYMEKLNVLFSCRTHGVPRLFQFDTGANETTFFVPYYQEFQADIVQQKHGRYQGYGAGGVVTHPVYILDHTQLQLGGHEADLEHVPVLTGPQNMLPDHYYGNLGRNLLSGFDSLTLDLTNDRVYLGPPLGPPLR